MASLYLLMRAIENSLEKQCNHTRPEDSNEFLKSHSTMKYIGISERTGHLFYKCSICGGIN